MVGLSMYARLGQADYFAGGGAQCVFSSFPKLLPIQTLGKLI